MRMSGTAVYGLGFSRCVSCNQCQIHPETLSPRVASSNRAAAQQHIGCITHNLPMHGRNLPMDEGPHIRVMHAYLKQALVTRKIVTDFTPQPHTATACVGRYCISQLDWWDRRLHHLRICQHLPAVWPNQRHCEINM
jgi:hypothetical protein